MKINLSIFFKYFCLISIIFFLLVSLSHAEGSKGKQNFLLTIPKKRLECKKKAQKVWDSGSTSEMIDASYEYGECLEKMIIKLATEYYPKGAFGSKGIKILLDDLQKNRSVLYEALYNGCELCDGTMWEVIAADAAFDELEEILHKMATRILDVGWEKEIVDKFEADWKAGSD